MIYSMTNTMPEKVQKNMTEAEKTYERLKLRFRREEKTMELIKPTKFYNRVEAAFLGCVSKTTIDRYYRQGLFNEGEVRIVGPRRMFQGKGLLRICYGID